MLDTTTTRFWLSFADPHRPAGDQFLGVAIVPAATFVGAVTEAHRLGINPGGEVEGAAMLPHMQVPDDVVARLLSKDEALQLAANIDAQDGGANG